MSYPSQRFDYTNKMENWRDIEELARRKSMSLEPYIENLGIQPPKALTLSQLSITAYLQRMSRPAISHLDSKNASSFTSIDDVVIVAHLEPDNKGLEERFTKTAEQYRDRYTFAIRPRKAHGASLECMNNINFEQLSITDLSDPLAIDNFVTQCARPLIPAFTRRSELEFAKVEFPTRVYATHTCEADKF